MSQPSPTVAATTDLMPLEAIDPVDFGRWLRAHDGDESCGVSQDGVNCPLARYLTETHGRQVRVGANWAFDAVTDEPAIPLPQWAAHFVTNVDEWIGPISFDAALDILYWSTAPGG